MNIQLRFIGTEMAEMTIESTDVTMSQTITNLQGLVDDRFIENLERITQDLRDHNNYVMEHK